MCMKFCPSSSSTVQFANRDLAQSLRELIDKYQALGDGEVSGFFFFGLFHLG